MNDQPHPITTQKRDKNQHPKLFLTTLATIIAVAIMIILSYPNTITPKNTGNIQAQSTPVVDSQQSQIESLQFALQSTELFHQSETNAELAMLLAIRGLNKAYTPEAYRALHQALPYLQGSIVLSEHTNGVRGARELSDGRILSWSEDGTLRLWDENGQFINTLAGHAAIVLSAIELSDGRILSWGEDNALRIWDKDGLPLTKLTGHLYPIKDAIEISDGRILSWEWANSLLLWDESGQYKRLVAPTSDINGAMQLPDGRLLVWGGHGNDGYLYLLDNDGNFITSYRHLGLEVIGVMLFGSSTDLVVSWAEGSGQILMWNLTTGESSILSDSASGTLGALKLFDGRMAFWRSNGSIMVMSRFGGFSQLSEHTERVRGLIELQDNNLLSWGDDNILVRWYWNTYNDEYYPTRLSGHTDKVLGATQLSDGRILSWSEDKTLRIWSHSLHIISTLVGHTDGIGGAIELSNDKILSWGASSTIPGSDSMLRIWDTQQAYPTAFWGHGNPGLRVIELSDGRILSWNDDYSLRLWDKNGQLITTMQHVPFDISDGYVEGATELPDGRILSWGASGVKLWDSTGQLLTTITGGYRTRLSDGRIITSVSDYRLQIWDKDGLLLATLSGHTDWIRGVLALSSGRIVSWSNDDTLRLWDADGELIAVLSGHTNTINGVLELSSGRFVSWSYDDTLRLWDADGQLITVLSGHTDWINGVVELSSGRFVSWGVDKTLRLWDADGQLIAVLSGHSNGISGVLELLDGNIASWGFDTTPRIWDNNGELIAILQGTNLYQLSDGRIISGGDSLRVWDADFRLILSMPMPSGGSVRPLSDNSILSRNYNVMYRWELYSPDEIRDFACSHLVRDLTHEERLFYQIRTETGDIDTSPTCP